MHTVKMAVGALASFSNSPVADLNADNKLLLSLKSFFKKLIDEL